MLEKINLNKQIKISQKIIQQESNNLIVKPLTTVETTQEAWQFVEKHMNENTNATTSYLRCYMNNNQLILDYGNPNINYILDNVIINIYK